MNRRIFRSRLIYWFSIVSFSLLTLILFYKTITILSNGFNFVHFFYLLLLSILSLISCIKLFEKEKNVIVFMNLSLILLIILLVYTAFSFYPTHYIYIPENFKYAAFFIMYLILININKFKHKNFDEIEEIGNRKGKA